MGAVEFIPNPYNPPPKLRPILTGPRLAPPSKRCLAHSLRVTVVGCVVIIVIFFAVTVVFLFVFLLVRLLSKEDNGSYQPMRMVCVGAFRMYSAHVSMVRPAAFGNGCNSIRLFANLFPGTLSRQSLLHSALIARLR